jgi:Flp pilus assembly protein TadG
MSRRMFRNLSSLPRAASGGAAVEFALVLPLLTAFIVAIIQYGGMLIAYDQMHDAVSSSAVYVMRGGTNQTAIHDVAVSAWANKPSDASVSVSQTCVCLGVGATCSALCSDGSYPQSFTSIGATGSYTGLWGNQAMSSSQIVRTQ